jgi:hypothetical protein
MTFEEQLTRETWIKGRVAHQHTFTATLQRTLPEKISGRDSFKGEDCNTPGVTMARAHLCTNDCDHMWKKLKEKSIRTLEARF